MKHLPITQEQISQLQLRDFIEDKTYYITTEDNTNEEYYFLTDLNGVQAILLTRSSIPFYIREINEEEDILDLLFPFMDEDDEIHCEFTTLKIKDYLRTQNII